MTALHPVAPAQRTGEVPAPGSAPSIEALEFLRAAEAVAGAPGRRCEGGSTCRRPGALTLVTTDGTTALCGLHAMNAVFSSEGGTLALVRPAP
jgi:hypothetical protein